MTEGNEPQYERFAREYEKHASESPFNAYCDRPAVLSLIGDVGGNSVLDVGCGPGFYAEELTKRGAEVVAFDQSPRMVELTKTRLGRSAQVSVHDLEQPLDWLADDTFDLALMALVIHHIENRTAALREVRRVLKPTGRLIISTHHPTADWIRIGDNYFDVEAVEERWTKGWDLRYWRMPLSRITDEILDTGFMIERVVERRAVPELEQIDADDFKTLTTEPRFICFSLVKPDASNPKG